MNSGVHRAIAPAPPKDSNSIHGAGVAEIASAPESSTSCPERLSKELPPGANASYPERSPEELQSGANGFAIDFARQVFNEEEAGRTLTGASIPIPDDTEAPTLDNSLWHHPTEVELPPEAVILALVDVYFDHAIHESFRVATAAALRISHIPVLRFKHHFAESFASLQQFTAGVILCILPTCQPFTSAAHEAKAGIIRIIHASSAFGPRNRIAKQTVQLLTELLKVTVDREMSSALRRGVETIIPRRISERGSILNAQPRIDHTRSDSLSSRDTSLDQSSTSTSHALPQAIHDHSRVNDRIAQAPVKPPEYPSANIFEQLDDTFAAFGERMFNLISDDQSSAWNWGRTVP
ncbi:hypothetical protein DTO012A8_9194 [Penicillium roqueforti]|nr:hypothetical protein DTO012A8_9194 [Penicillium roqueforti]